MNYTIPRDLFNELVKNVGKESAEKFANAFESFLKLYNELRSELATKEFVRAEINEVRAEINEVRAEIQKNTLLLKVLIGISIFALTIFNPNFITLIEKIFK